MGASEEDIQHVRIPCPIHKCRYEDKYGVVRLGTAQILTCFTFPPLIPFRPFGDRFWSLATDALPPQDSAALAEDLGIEFDTSEHTALEKGPLCAPKNSILGKRRR